jgi:hypothetical protein
MFCWSCLSKCACNETNPMRYLSSLYWVTTPLHVSGLLVAHHQEIAMYICDNWYVLYVLVDCRRARVWGQRRWVKYWARLGCWISQCYGPFSLGARFETYGVHFFNFQIFFRAAVNRGYWISGYRGTPLLLFFLQNYACLYNLPRLLVASS